MTSDGRIFGRLYIGMHGRLRREPHVFTIITNIAPLYAAVIVAPNAVRRVKKSPAGFRQRGKVATHSAQELGDLRNPKVRLDCGGNAAIAAQIPRSRV
jgi:hypothetical protein